MTRYFLVKLCIEGFRGINNENGPLVLAFRRDAVNSVFASNGLGKSSIFEALSFAIRGSIPKLDALPAADAPESYYINRFHSGKRATIGLTFESDDGSPVVDIVVERSAAGARKVSSPSSYPDPEKLLRSFDNAAALLDHQTFDGFVEDTPLKRGRAFSVLLGLGRLSEYRQVLELLSNAKTLKSDFHLDILDAQHTSESQQVDAAFERIRKAYDGFIGQPLPTPFEPQSVAITAHAALAAIPLATPFVFEKTFATVNFIEIQAAVKEAEGSDKRRRLAHVLRDIDELGKLVPAPTEHAEQDGLRETMRARDAAIAGTRGAPFQKLYEAAEGIVSAAEWSDPHECPLCETRNLSTTLAEHITAHLETFAAAREAQTQIVTKWSVAGWVRRMKDLDIRLAVPGAARESSSVDEIFRLKTPAVGDFQTAIDLLSDLDTRRSEKVAELESERAELERDLPPSLVALTEQIQKASQLQSALADHSKYLRAAAATQTKLERRRRWVKFIEEACTSFADAEVALSTAQTLAIEKEYRALYEAVAQNPEVVPLLRKAPGSEELHLRLEKFYGLKDLAATTLLPESYRNALAICIFLSAAQTTARSAGFMVLDDVTSSFDAMHQFALMEVLRTKVAMPANPTGPQIVILSHDGLLEKYFDTLSNEAGWHHQRLQGMPPQGAVLSQTQNVQRLRTSAEAFLSAGQTQQASPLIRQHLEYILLQIIRRLAIPVPLDFSIRDDRKMAENCLSVIREAVDLHAAAGDLILPQAQRDALSKVHAPKILGNWVNHYATGNTASLSAHVLLGVLAAMDDFADCFKYDCRCGGGAQRRFYKNLAQKACNC